MNKRLALVGLEKLPQLLALNADRSQQGKVRDFRRESFTRFISAATEDAVLAHVLATAKVQVKRKVQDTSRSVLDIYTVALQRKEEIRFLALVTHPQSRLEHGYNDGPEILGELEPRKGIFRVKFDFGTNGHMHDRFEIELKQLDFVPTTQISFPANGIVGFVRFSTISDKGIRLALYDETDDSCLETHFKTLETVARVLTDLKAVGVRIQDIDAGVMNALTALLA